MEVFTKTDMSKQKQVFQKSTDRAEEAPDPEAACAGEDLASSSSRKEGANHLRVSGAAGKIEEHHVCLRSDHCETGQGGAGQRPGIPLEDQKKALEP